jgi:hypothetical protein
MSHTYLFLYHNLPGTLNCISGAIDSRHPWLYESAETGPITPPVAPTSIYKKVWRELLVKHVSALRMGQLSPKRMRKSVTMRARLRNENPSNYLARHERPASRQ